MKVALRRVGFYVLLIAIWQAISSAAIWPDYLFPSPRGVAQALGEGFSNHTLIWGILVSLRRIAIGYGISLFFGVAVGLLVGRIRILEETVGSLISGLQALPSICWFPLAILWFGLSESAILFVVVMGAFFAITIATDSGVRSIPPLYIRAGRNLGARGWRLYWFVLLPAALPAIVSGMKLGWAFAWRALMGGELLFVSLGLGHLLMLGRELNDMNQVVAVMLVIMAIGIFVDRFAFVRLEQKVHAQWGLKEQ